MIFPIPGDPYYDNVGLLLPMNGANNSTTFTDYSKSPKTATAYGDAKISTTQSKFNGSSGYFDGTGDYIYIDDHDDFDFGTGNFTIETWFRTTKLDGTRQLMMGQCDSLGSEASLNFTFDIQTDNKLYPNFRIGSTTYYKGGGNNGSGASISINTWHHFAVVRSGTTIYYYLDGTSASSFSVGSSAVNNSSSKFALGRAGQYETSPYYGYMQFLRITKGVARYTGAFTALTYPLSPRYVELYNTPVSRSPVHQDFSVARLGL